MNDWKLIGPIIAAVVALFGWFLKHVTGDRKHPCADNLVYRDVCDERSKRIEHCLEGAIKRSEQQYQDLKTDMKDGFDRIEKKL